MSCHAANARHDHCGTRVSLLCHSVLHKIEANLVKKKDIAIKKDHADPTIEYRVKRRFKGFMREIPGWMIDSFKLCASQLGSKRQENSRFMRSMSDKRGTRVQSVGEHALSNVAKELATRLGKDLKNYAAKSFRRLAAT